MKIRLSEVRHVLERIVLEAIGDEPAVDIRFVEGETLPLFREVRVKKLNDDTFFGGEPKGPGATYKILPAGTECVVLQRIGGKAAWFEVEGFDAPIRMDINKFCPTKAEVYLSRQRKKAQMAPPPLRNKATSAVASHVKSTNSVEDAERQLRAAEQAMMLAKQQLEKLKASQEYAKEPEEEHTEDEEPSEWEDTGDSDWESVLNDLSPQQKSKR